MLKWPTTPLFVQQNNLVNNEENTKTIHWWPFVRGIHQQPEIIFCMRSANERRRYNVTSSLICWAHTENGPWCRKLSHVMTSLCDVPPTPSVHESACRVDSPGLGWLDNLMAAPSVSPRALNMLHSFDFMVHKCTTVRCCSRFHHLLLR